jgi:hypothetical protein
MKSVFKFIIGVAIGISGFWVFNRYVSSDDVKYVVLFAPYRVESEFENALPANNQWFAKKLVDVSNSKEGWHMAIVSNAGKIRVIPMDDIHIEPPTNRTIVVWP